MLHKNVDSAIALTGTFSPEIRDSILNKEKDGVPILQVTLRTI